MGLPPWAGVEIGTTIAGRGKCIVRVIDGPRRGATSRPTTSSQRGEDLARGFLSGVLAGGFISVLGLGTASLLGEQPAGNAPPEAPQVDAPDVAVAEEPTPEVVSMTNPGEGDGPSLAPAPDVDAPGAVSTLPVADTAPPDMPEAGLVEGEMAEPEAVDGSDIALETDAPVLPSPQASAPETPVTEADIVLSTEPSPPPAPVVVEETPEEVSATPEEPEDFVVSEDAVVAEEAPIVVEVTDDAPAPDENPSPEEESPVEADDPQLAEPAQDPEADPTPSTGIQLQGGENSLLADRGTGVTIRRPGADDEAPEVAGEAAAQGSDAPALTRYAAATNNPDDLPLMSVVLVDDGEMPAASAALAGLPFPVTIAIDPARPDASDMLRRYRDEGFEVVVLARLPVGATPADVEISFEGVFAELEETIAVLDLGDGGLQDSRAATEQAMEILAAGGRGFVTVSQGLNTASRAAEQAGVPSAVVYRDLDAEGQEARIIRRFVDQAAFRARQESGVVLVGRVRPDTISALILWGTANRAGQVAQVPLSAVLSAGE